MIALLASDADPADEGVTQVIDRLIDWLRSLLPAVFGAGSDPVDAPPNDLPQARDRQPAGRVRGIDVSHWNGLVDHAAAAEGGVAFVIAKATQGTYLTDPRFAANVAAGREAGLVVGAYHFYDYRQPGRAQARHLLDVLGDAGMLEDALPPVVDIECFAAFGSADQAVVRRELRAFSDAIFAATGRLPMIYTSGHMWEEVTGDDPGFGDHPLWVACWRCPEPYLPAGWDDWLVWQIGSMAVQGHASRLDGNVARDARMLRASSRTAPVAPSETISRRSTITIPRPLEAGTRTRVRVDGGPWSQWSSPGARTRARLHGGDGPHTIDVQRRSSAGTLGPVVVTTVRLDRRPPAVTMTLDRESGTLRVEATDASGGSHVVARSICRADRTGRNLTVERRTGRDSVAIPLPALSGCVIRIEARDRAGNLIRSLSGPWRLAVPEQPGHRVS